MSAGVVVIRLRRLRRAWNVRRGNGLGLVRRFGIGARARTRARVRIWVGAGIGARCWLGVFPLSIERYRSTRFVAKIDDACLIGTAFA